MRGSFVSVTIDGPPGQARHASPPYALSVRGTGRS
jgi:hypothetical protein